MLRKIAISDIHGCCKTFRKLVESTLCLHLEDELYLLGDYIDRGPDSKGVLDYILELKDKGYYIRTLTGNHELMLLGNKTQATSFPAWESINGGALTLKSFGVKYIDDIPALYWDFFNNLEFYISLDHYLLVHAGFNFELDNIFSDTNAMAWIRSWYSSFDKIKAQNKIIIHGHTPIGKKYILNSLKNLYIYPILNIDNGCFRTNNEGMRQLCAFDMTNGKLYFERNIDDMSAWDKQFELIKHKINLL